MNESPNGRFRKQNEFKLIVFLRQMTELRADDELESAADKLESEGRTEFARSAKTLFNNDVRNYDRMNSRRGGTDEKQTKNRLFKAFMKFFKEKFGNEKDN